MSYCCLRLRYKLRNKKVVSTMWVICIAGVVVVYVVLPLCFYFIKSVPRGLVFVPFVRRGSPEALQHPEKQGLLGSRNFYLKTPSGVSIGTWHILPASLAPSAESTPEFYEQSLRGGAPVVLYMHGNSGSRATPHRIELYQVLRGLGFHIITFDYRSYGDSSDVAASETGVLEDGMTLYKWVKSHLGSSSAPLIVWGHSLGTGISSRVVKEVTLAGDPPTALVLESPFTNIAEEVSKHPLSILHRKMPGWQTLFLDTLKRIDISFQTDRNILSIHIPILILHAEDDLIIPYELGEKLYKIAEAGRPRTAAEVKFVGFSRDAGYGHKFICRAPELPDIIRKFANLESVISVENHK